MICIFSKTTLLMVLTITDKKILRAHGFYDKNQVPRKKEMQNKLKIARQKLKSIENKENCSASIIAKRRQLTIETKYKLEKFFLECQHPDITTMTLPAKKFNTTQHRISQWFRTKRYYTKKTRSEGNEILIPPTGDKFRADVEALLTSVEQGTGEFSDEQEQRRNNTNPEQQTIPVVTEQKQQHHLISNDHTRSAINCSTSNYVQQEHTDYNPDYIPPYHFYGPQQPNACPCYVQPAHYYCTATPISNYCTKYM